MAADVLFVEPMAHKNKTNRSPYTDRKNISAQPVLRGRHKKPQIIFPLEEANDRLYDIFKNHHFDLVTHEERKKLAHFYKLLMENQEKENFTRLLSIKDIAIKHFIDSLIILKHCQLIFPLMDLGTGPGFPGIPLKVKFPQEKIVLAEGVQKRVSFLKKCREELSLKNLEIMGRNVNSEFLYPVKGVITRAVEDISNTLNNVMNCLEPQGKVFFMKGPNVDPEIQSAEKNLSEYYVLESDISYKIPETPFDRRLVIYRKL